ncbi:MAG: DNA ligase [Oscillospiraceae bacterium]|nr:DNA ligase [Oscillospiraceae bacterium]
MGKTSELSILIDELKTCGETLIGISQGLSELFSGAAENQKSDEPTTVTEEQSKTAEEKVLKLEEVRAVLAEKSRAGFTAQIREILVKHGAEKLSAVNPSEYEALLKEVEVL